MKLGNLRQLSALALALLLTGCGGGGGGGGGSSGNNNGGGNTGGNNGGSTPTLTCSLPETAISLTTPTDPLLVDQWHLINSTNTADINIKPLWDAQPSTGFKGEGVVIAVVDDGIEIAHPDLAANTLDLCHRDFRVSSSTRNQDPTPSNAEDAHGTAVAGIIAARDNDIGVTGVAPRASLAGINLIGQYSVSNSAAAMTHHSSVISVSNNSWGSIDFTGRLTPAETTWRNAIDRGINNGADGKGIAYFFAAGNGHDGYSYNGSNFSRHPALPAPDSENLYFFIDTSNLDEQAGYHGVMTIGSVNAENKRASYSEVGTNILISAYGGEFCETNQPTIVTTDLTGLDQGKNRGTNNELADTNYTRCFNGTSAATPIVSGVAALMRQANPALSWRDIRWILAKNAKTIDESDPYWSTNDAGLAYNFQYGFGVVDAEKSVNAARSHSLLPEYQRIRKSNIYSREIPSNAPPTTVQLSVSIEEINKIEHVALYANIAAATDETDPDKFNTGFLKIEIISPKGTVSPVLMPRLCPNSKKELDFCESRINSGFTAQNYSLSSMQFLGEDPNGEWSIKIYNYGIIDAEIKTWSLYFSGHKE